MQLLVPMSFTSRSGCLISAACGNTAANPSGERVRLLTSLMRAARAPNSGRSNDAKSCAAYWASLKQSSALELLPRCSASAIGDEDTAARVGRSALKISFGGLYTF
eukprot:1398578-Prymnesium_polylepis.1